LHLSAWLRCRQEDQGQEAAYSRRHARLLDARHRRCRRHPRPRRRRAPDGLTATLFGLYPFLLTLYADGGYQGAGFQGALRIILRRVNVELVERSDQAQIFVVNRKALAFLKLASIRLMLRKPCNPR